MRGFEVLETLDTNHDGKVVSFPAPLRHNAADTDFASLRVWQDANEDGACDAGDPKTLAELRRMQGRLLVGNRRPNQGCGHPKAQQRAIASISVNRTDVTGTNEGHDRGFAATFTRAHFPRAFSCPPATGAGSTGAAETITFQTDTADTVDPTPEFFRYDDSKFRHRTLLDQQIFVLKTIGARNGMGAKIRTGRVHCFYGAGR